MKRLFTYVFLMLLLVSCQKLFFNDDEETRVIQLGDFNAADISGIYDIVLIQDSTNKLVINGKKDVNSITAVVRNDTLVIDDHKRMSVNPDKNTLTIHFTNIEHLVTNDPVYISNNDTIRTDRFIYAGIGEIAEARLVVDCDYFLIVNSANTLGYSYISGYANSAVLFNRYGSSIFAENLKCRNVEALNGSVGDIYLSASDNITASIWGSGNIYYHGKPAVKVTEQTGSGKIIPLD
ncbi:MAG: DUF2807 domain-containing protein [Bacteroidales bacterium]|nr:DUF2807 domain-containing protein [Bacteroidales bacterium]